MAERFNYSPAQEEPHQNTTDEQERRFDQHADFLDIPEESLEHPLVREFVTFSLRMHQLREDLGIASARRGGLGVRFEAGIEPTLADRYDRACDMMTAAIELLLDGLPPDGDADVDCLQTKINDALACYGLTVVDADPNSNQQRAVRQTGRYRGKPLPPEIDD